ncbi:MAG: hypothetical protein J1F68_02685 [Clostridiales bacterium]|nr:hypothetical protein [Clostridiales bacterium]
MYKISELVGKNLLDVNSAQDFGQISDFVYDKATGLGALETDTGRYSAEKVFSVMDAVSVIDANKMEGGEKLVGKIAYDTTGKYLGKIYEVEFGNTLKPSKITLIDGTEYSRGKIYAVKDVALIRARTPVSKKQVTTPTATAPQDNTAKPKLKQKAVYSRWMQNRKYGDFSFLIGKITDKTITNFQGEVMVKNGEKVTQDVLRQAKISGKLIELCLHTK